MLPFLVALALVQNAPQAEPEQPAPDPQDEVSAPVSTIQSVAPPPVAPPPPPVAYVTESAPSEDQGASPQAYPTAGAGDRRLQLLTYDPDQVVTLPVSPGFASVIELGEDERVENVVVGNSAAWQVTANRRGDRVIVKPLGGAGTSNLIVLTGLRRYVFVLDPFGETSFITRFRYASAPAAAAAAAYVAANTVAYRFRGAKALFPLAMSDDGRRTTIRWNPQTSLPAIFALNGRKETLVNGRMVGNDYVIEGAAPRYKFRYGKAEATAIRQTPKRRR